MRRLLVLVALALAVSVGNAQATTVTFEDVAIADGPTFATDVTSGGFFFDTATNHSHITTGDAFASNGTQFMGIDAFGGPTTTISPVGGGPFAFNSIDIGEWSFGGGTLWARHVVVTGNLFGGGTLSRTLDLNGIFDGPGGVADFQTFAFDASWTNLSSVVLQGTGGDPGNYFGIDNVVVNAVPEPGTLTLIGFGSAYLIRRRRRNRR
jgi:hypothetical protein